MFQLLVKSIDGAVKAVDLSAPNGVGIKFHELAKAVETATNIPTRHLVLTYNDRKLQRTEDVRHLMETHGGTPTLCVFSKAPRFSDCETHRGTEADYYCQTCKDIRCPRCLAQHANKTGHKMVDLTDAANFAEYVGDEFAAEEARCRKHLSQEAERCQQLMTELQRISDAHEAALLQHFKDFFELSGKLVLLQNHRDASAPHEKARWLRDYN